MVIDRMFNKIPLYPTDQGAVLFTTPRLKAMDIASGDYQELCNYWDENPPTDDYHAWDSAKKIELMQDMISDQSETPRSCYRMIVRDDASNNFVGYINAWKVAGYHFLPELGIALMSSYRDRGYGTEIYRALSEFAFDKFCDDNHLQAVLNPENIGSLKMHFNCGWQPFCFVKDAYTAGNITEDEMTMRISRAHFERNGARSVAFSL